MSCRLLLLVRAAWIALVLISLSVLLAGMPAYFLRLESICFGGECIYFQLGPAEASALGNLNLSLTFYAAYMAGLTSLVSIVSLLLAILVFWWQSNSSMAIFLSVALVGLGPTFFQVLTEALVKDNPAWRLPVSLMQAVGVWTLIVFSYLFPNSRFYPRWTRLVAIVLAAAALSLVFSTDPFVLGALTAFGWFILFIIVGSMIVGAVAQITRYRRISGPIERQQIKWVVFGFALFALQASVFILSPLIYSPLRDQGVQKLLYYLVGGSLNVLFLLFFLFSLATAILRYRLWDIDIIIRRTLIYGALTTSLAVVYFGSVVLLQGLFQTLTGQGQSTVVTVISTLAIAALFTPLRRRIQNDIDRRFFRRKYDAEKTLEAFAATVRQQVDLDEISESLLNVVQETMQPEQVSLWLRSPSGK